MRLSSCRLWLFALGALLPHGQAQEKATGEKRTTAYDAVRLLDAQQQAALAMVAARDGTPDPKRGHLLVHDPST